MPYDILIVDDSDVTRAMIIKTLALADIPIAHCHQAADGREALEMLEEHWVDLVMADLNMPIMGGPELLRIMRASRQLADVPVIVVTSEHCTPEQLQETWKAAAYVRKPFTPEDIRDAFGLLLHEDEHPPTPDLVMEHFSSVLETVAFMFVESISDTAPSDLSSEFFRARMAFSGFVSGVMTLAVPRTLAVQMAANAMGLEPDDPIAVEHDADIVGELLNITCGHVAEHVSGGEDVAFEPPVINRHDAADWAAFADDPSLSWALVEGYPLVIGLRTRLVR